MSIHGRFPTSPSNPASSSSPNSQSQSQSSPDLKQKVNFLLNKLADRDTFALASTELTSITRNLTQDSFSTFFNCLSTVDSSTKSPVRTQSVALLSVMCRHHGEALLPHLSKIVCVVIRRLRDPDSSVRSACVSASADMVACVTRQPFVTVAKPFLETLIQEGDCNAQIGAALCFSASVEAVSGPEIEKLRKSVAKIVKLVKSEGFKAKAALLSAVGSVIGAGGAGSKLALDLLVPLLIEFLSNEDWAARKCAAEGLSKIATVEELASQYKKLCITALESRRFDKVKTVRETMNQTLNLWKQVQNDFNEASPSRSSTDDGNIDMGSKSSRLKKVTPLIKRSPSMPITRSYTTSTGQKTNLSKPNQETLTKSEGPDIIKHTISEKSNEGKVSSFDGSRSSSKAALCSNDGGKDDDDESKKQSEELSLIREQLALIENQQSSLLDLLQKFMGSSQSGIQSLESRVSSLEMAFNDISTDLAASNGRKPEERPVRNRASEMPARENSFDQGMQGSKNAIHDQTGSSVFQKRASRKNQFQDSMHTTTRLST